MSNGFFSARVGIESPRRLPVRGQWKYDELLVQAVGGPKPAGVPYIWEWATLYPKLVEACEVLPESFTAHRHLAFMNPGLPRGGATHTILMGLQMVRPAELAWAHRHSISALRFVVQGNEHAYTLVDGEICPMEDYDLILTPQYSWHDHRNETDGHVIWLDVLDVPLILALNATCAGILRRVYSVGRWELKRKFRVNPLFHSLCKAL